LKDIFVVREGQYTINKASVKIERPFLEWLYLQV